MSANPPKRRTLSSVSPFSQVGREVRQRHGLRAPILRKLEKEFGATVLTFFTSFSPRKYGSISDNDAEMIESVLAAEYVRGKLLLVVNSPGGDGMAAERIAHICRQYSGNEFEVAVPHMAKSAATIICFGAKAIHMGATAELGPVDPQVPYGDAGERWISAEEYVRSYDTLMTSASGGTFTRIEPFLQQLNRYDARYIEQLRSAQKLSNDIAIRLLETGMLAGMPRPQIEDKMKIFLRQSETSSHGRMISPVEAKTCDLKIVPVDLMSNKWNLLWELYVRSNWVVTEGEGISKLIESVNSSVQS